MDDNAESPISDEQRLLPSDARTRKTSEQGRFLNALTATNDPSLMLTTLRMLEHQDDLDGFREGVRMLEALAENRALTPETVDILLRLSTKLDLDLEFDLASCERMTIEQQVHLAALGDGHVQWALAHNQFVVAEALVVIAGSCTEVRLAEQVLNNPNVSTAVRDAVPEHLMQAVAEKRRHLREQMASWTEPDDWPSLDEVCEANAEYLAAQCEHLPEDLALELCRQDTPVRALVEDRLAMNSYTFQQVFPPDLIAGI